MIRRKLVEDLKDSALWIPGERAIEQKKQLVQRPWGGCKLGVFKAQ